MKKLVIIALLVCTAAQAPARTDSTQYVNKKSLPSYEAKQALELESLVPMFFTGGYHVGVGYRYHKFRLRVSVINGGHYDAETAGVNNSSAAFKRYYKTSPGFFFGYNVWRNLELYTYVEMHTFEIEQKSTGWKQDMHSTDFGGGISYQFFIGRYFYIQPGLHVYLRGDNSLNFGEQTYNIPNVDLSPVLRLGFRYWSKY